MPTFCRHNRLIQNCTICSREQSIEPRPIVSSSTPASSARAPRAARPSSGGGSRGGAAVRVSRLERGADDGYRNQLVPGVKSSADGERLAEELAFAARRLELLATDPPGLYREVGSDELEIEERSWLAFLIAYLGPLDHEDPFAEIARVRTTWAAAEDPALDGVATGPRSAHEERRGTRTIDAYRAWAARAGSQAAAFTGEAARFDLLVTLGTLGVYELVAGALQFGGDNETTIAAKRVFGIGDPLLLERRATELARACGLPIATLDAGLYNWGRGGRATLGLGDGMTVDDEALDSARAALGL